MRRQAIVYQRDVKGTAGGSLWWHVSSGTSRRAAPRPVAPERIAGRLRQRSKSGSTHVSATIGPTRMARPREASNSVADDQRNTAKRTMGRPVRHGQGWTPEWAYGECQEAAADRCHGEHVLLHDEREMWGWRPALRYRFLAR